MPHGDAGSACDSAPGAPMATIGGTIGCAPIMVLATPHGITPWDVAVLVAAVILGACAAPTIAAVSNSPPSPCPLQRRLSRG